MTPRYVYRFNCSRCEDAGLVAVEGADRRYPDQVLVYVYRCSCQAGARYEKNFVLAPRPEPEGGGW
jgi:hypothetical protein